MSARPFSIVAAIVLTLPAAAQAVLAEPPPISVTIPPGPYAPVRTLPLETVLTGASARRSPATLAAVRDLGILRSATDRNVRAVFGGFDNHLANASDEELAYALGVVRSLPSVARFGRTVDRVTVRGGEAEVHARDGRRSTVVQLRQSRGAWTLRTVRSSLDGDPPPPPFQPR